MKFKLKHCYGFFGFFIATFFPILPMQHHGTAALAMQQQNAANSTVSAKIKRAICAGKATLTRQLVHPWLTPIHTIDANADEEQRYPAVVTQERKNRIADFAHLYATGFSLMPMTLVTAITIETVGSAIVGREAFKSFLKQKDGAYAMFLLGGIFALNTLTVPCASGLLRRASRTYPFYVELPIYLLATIHGAVVTFKLLQEHCKQ